MDFKCVSKKIKSIAVQKFATDLDSKKALKSIGVPATPQNVENLVKSPQVYKTIKKDVINKLESLDITIDWIIQEIASVAKAPIGDDLVTINEKLKALDMLCKYYNLYNEINNISITQNNYSNTFQVEFLESSQPPESN